MKLLLDTHLLLWAASNSAKLSAVARRLIDNEQNELLFSAASIWELAIKRSLPRSKFQIQPRVFRRGLIDNGYVELPISSEHAVAIDLLPDLHKDPFDRILLAQAVTEGVTLLTVDPVVAQYPGPVRKV